MKQTKFKIILLGVMALSLTGIRCTKLDAKVYSQIVNENFWSTPEEIAAGKSPAYAALQSVPGQSGVYWENEISSDEMITPTRGGDWGDGGQWTNIFYHSETADNGFNSWAWGVIYDGIGKCNYIIYTLQNLNPAPATLKSDLAEMKTLRSYYYYLALDLFGNIPYVTNFKQDPSTVVNIPRAQVYDSLVAELNANLPDLTTDRSLATYGKVNTYFAHSILAKLYLNAEVYTGTPKWQECIDQCKLITAGGYSLMSNYYDNFRDAVQEASTENIFSVPYKANVMPAGGGNYIVVASLQFNNAFLTFQQNGMGNNGMCTTKPFYDYYDTTSIYETRVVDGNTNVYRTFKDQRTGQFLIGQQYVKGITYPPHANILYSSSNTLPAGLPNSDPGAITIYDDQSQLPLAYFDTMTLISNPAPYFRMAGLRNIKYWPEPGGNVGDNISNDVPLFRYADILLMQAECEVRLNKDLGEALDLVNAVRRRAYSGSSDPKWPWTSDKLTLDNLYAERARELAWEMVRRQDMIRFGHFLESRTFPDKPADPSDKHTYILPIPSSVILSNPNITQNPGY
ncbi:RagB/SusD family nutrient uptake outer membrane protein [Flavihumibacter profundi]|uniref:RagB/SusD family nutrient uptake outer membrane protein n=1 Tax=Flavihumibacter profundi TaxID=2716883 RepID=UPI001CC4E6EF|nr:RagB/SusD family nutrient uptake outer membrane protein [Flavihumibacter profundi]MBZ5856920.1 RagB/SusD family nutrient uptake outer membrane protein [Flavihumibacter profundi]